ncbi:MAG TPA: hypothetical protein VJT72_00325 [Pseudonocardiaceae bacterium]|nr:hypothetical protein [Pseudonocardiaceae bacterium]
MHHASQNHHTPGRERLGGPGPLSAPRGQPHPGCLAGESVVGPLRWVRCPDDGHLHLLTPAEVVVAATRGHATTLCGQPLPAAGLTLTHGSSTAVCLACVAGIPCPTSDPLLHEYPATSHTLDPPLISASVAAQALQEYFLANADRGDNAANDELVTELLRRIRALRASHDSGC